MASVSLSSSSFLNRVEGASFSGAARRPSLNSILETIRGIPADFALSLVNTAPLNPAFIAMAIRSVTEANPTIYLEENKPLIDLFIGLHLQETSDQDLLTLFQSCPQRDRLCFLVYKAHGSSSEDPQYGENQILQRPRVLMDALSWLSMQDLSQEIFTAEDRSVKAIFTAWEEDKLVHLFSSEEKLEDALYGAAGQGHLELVQFLLSEGRAISEVALGGTVRVAAQNGRLDVVQFLLSEERAISEADSGLAIFHAAGSGHLEVVRFLLTEGRAISEVGLKSAVSSAARGGHLEVVRLFLSEGRAISEEGLKSAVSSAAIGGHLEVVQFLLSEVRTISEVDLGWAVVLAARGGHLEVIRLLLSEGRTISETDLEDAVRRAAENGHLEVVRLLLSDGRTMSKRALEFAVEDAAKGGRLEVVRFLLSEVRDISELYLGRAVSSAAKSGRLEVVRFLLSEGRAISQDALGRAVSSAAENGHLEVVQFLLSEGRDISQDALGRAVSSAAENGHLELVRFLLSEGRAISEEGLKSAVSSAAGSGHLEVVRLLLSEGRAISQDALGGAVSSAAGSGHLEVVRFLLSEGRAISQDALGYAVRDAAENGHLEVVQFLLSEGRAISQAALGRAVSSAAGSGHLDVIRLLLSEGRAISQAALGGAVSSAAGSGHLEVVQFLLSEGRDISQYALGCAVEYAAYNGHLEVVRFLLSEGRSITDISMRSQLVMLCSQRGYAEILEHLLQSGPILRSNRDSAVSLASGPQRDQIRQILQMALVIEDHMISIGTPFDPYSLTIPSLLDVEENPIGYLEDIISKERLPSRIYLQGSTAVDLGGITKEFVTRLFMGLIKKEFIPFYGETALPSIQGDKLSDMKKLGALYSILYARNASKTDKALTGSVFSAVFFELIHRASFETEETCLQFLATRLQESSHYAKLILNPEDEALQQVLAEALGIEKDEALATAKEELLSIIQAARAFYEATSGSFKDAISSKVPEVLCIEVQGEDITAEKLVLAITTDNPSEDLLLKLDWLIEKINTSDDAFRKAFLQMITGQSTIRPGLAIRIHLTGRADGSTFEAHTCFNSLDLPRAEMDKEVFLEALDAVVYSSGYNIA